MELIPVHNLYWKKYLTYGYHNLISMWMDDFGLPIYRDVVKIIHQDDSEKRWCNYSKIRKR